MAKKYQSYKHSGVIAWCNEVVALSAGLFNAFFK